MLDEHPVLGMSCCGVNPNDVITELSALGPAGYAELVSALSLRASQITRRKRWAPNNPLGTPAGIEEFVFGVFDKVIAGERPWTRASGHTLRQHLFASLRSEIDNLAQRKDNTTRDEDVGTQASAPTISPENHAETREWIAHVQTVVFKATEGDMNLTRLVEQLLEGVWKPADLAESIECSVDETNVMLRKLRRRLNSMGARAQIEGRAP